MINFKELLDKLAALSGTLKAMQSNVLAETTIDEDFDFLAAEVPAAPNLAITSSMDDLFDGLDSKSSNAPVLPKKTANAEKLLKIIDELLLLVESLTRQLNQAESAAAKPAILKTATDFLKKYDFFIILAELLADLEKTPNLPDMKNLAKEIEEGFSPGLKMAGLPKPPPSLFSVQAREALQEKSKIAQLEVDKANVIADGLTSRAPEIAQNIKLLETRRKAITEASREAFIGQRTNPAVMARVAALNEASALYAQAIGDSQLLLQGASIALAVDIALIRDNIAYAEGLVKAFLPQAEKIDLSWLDDAKSMVMQAKNEKLITDVVKTTANLDVVERHLKTGVLELGRVFNDKSKYVTVETMRKDLLDLHYAPRKYAHRSHELYNILLQSLEYDLLPFLFRAGSPAKEDIKSFNKKLKKFIEGLDFLKAFTEESSQHKEIVQVCNEVKILVLSISSRLQTAFLQNTNIEILWQDKANWNNNLQTVLQKLSGLNGDLQKLNGERAESTRQWNAVHQPLLNLECMVDHNRLTKETSVPIYNLVEMARLLTQIISAAKAKQDLSSEFVTKAKALLTVVHTALENIAGINRISLADLNKQCVKYNPDHAVPTPPRANTLSPAFIRGHRRSTALPSSYAELESGSSAASSSAEAGPKTAKSASRLRTFSFRPRAQGGIVGLTELFISSKTATDPTIAANPALPLRSDSPSPTSG